MDSSKAYFAHELYFRLGSIFEANSGIIFSFISFGTLLKNKLTTIIDAILTNQKIVQKLFTPLNIKYVVNKIILTIINVIISVLINFFLIISRSLNCLSIFSELKKLFKKEISELFNKVNFFCSQEKLNLFILNIIIL